MTPWLKYNENLWNSQPALIFIEEHNYIYEVFTNYIVISHKNLFSLIHYIEENLRPYRNDIFTAYKEQSQDIKNLYGKIALLKNIMEKYDDRRYYFFIYNNFYNHNLIHENNYVLTHNAYENHNSHNSILISYWPKKAYESESLPHFHHQDAIKIYHQNYEVGNNQKFYFWNHIIEMVKLLALNFSIDDLKNHQKKLKGYGIDWICTKEHHKNYHELLQQLTGLSITPMVYNIFAWISCDQELDHLTTLRDDQYHSTTLLWKLIEAPILIEGPCPNPRDSFRENLFFQWSCSKKNYYYHKRKFIHKHQSNLQAIKSKNPGIFFHWPWQYFHSKTMDYPLEAIIKLHINKLWFQSIVGLDSCNSPSPSTITIKDYGWKCHQMPLDPWILSTNYLKDSIMLKIPIHHCYWTKHQGVSHLIIRIQEYNILSINLLIFMAKKQMKNDEISGNVYVVNYDNLIIEKLPVSLSGFFLLNILEEKFHKFFDDKIQGS
jgi:hypothetical protein